MRENPIDRILQVSRRLDDLEIKTANDVKEYISLVTELIYDQKMIGKVYDYYADDADVVLQSRINLKGPDEVSYDIMQFCTAFPDLRAEVRNIIVQQDEKGFKAFRRVNFSGTNTGTSIYGPPTGKSLGDECLCMSYMKLREVDGSWKISQEITNNSERQIRQTLTAE